MQPGDRYGKASGLARVLDAPTTSRIHTGDQIYFKLTLPPELAEQIASAKHPARAATSDHRGAHSDPTVGTTSEKTISKPTYKASASTIASTALARCKYCVRQSPLIGFARQ